VSGAETGAVAQDRDRAAGGGGLRRSAFRGRRPAPSRKIAIERQAAAACDGPLFTFGRTAAASIKACFGR